MRIFTKLFFKLIQGGTSLRWCLLDSQIQPLSNPQWMRILDLLWDRFILVFFDGNLIFSESWQEHLYHWGTVFYILWKQQLFLKRSKCQFGSGACYLSKSEHGYGEVNAAKNWPQPQMLKSMSALLGQGFGKIAHPLAKMLKKNSFYWSLQAVATFISLKLLSRGQCCSYLISLFHLQLSVMHQEKGLALCCYRKVILWHTSVSI